MNVVTTANTLKTIKMSAFVLVLHTFKRVLLLQDGGAVLRIVDSSGGVFVGFCE